MKGVSDFAVVYDISCNKERRVLMMIALILFNFKISYKIKDLYSSFRTPLKNALKSKKMTEVLNFSSESSLTLHVLKPQSLRRHSLDRERKPFASLLSPFYRLRRHSLDRERKLICHILIAFKQSEKAFS